MNNNPLVTMSLADPDALDNVKRRVTNESTRRGRKALRIPLSQSTAGASSGIAIPV